LSVSSSGKPRAPGVGPPRRLRDCPTPRSVHCSRSSLRVAAALQNPATQARGRRLLTTPRPPTALAHAPQLSRRAGRRLSAAQRGGSRRRQLTTR
jgi:hypothetical protein